MNSAPPKIAASGIRFAGIVLAAAALAVAAVVFFFNPATHQFYPVCQFHRLTGLNCPGCGMTRALYELLHGKLSGALRDNALFVMSLGAVMVRGAWFGWNKIRGRANGDFFPVKYLWPLLIITFLFAVLRNSQAFAILSP